MMDELTLFNLLKDKLINDLEHTDKFCFYDAYSKKYNLIIELKCRNTHYQELIIEKVKWNRFINYNARYINSTPIGVYSFNPKVLKPIWVTREMPLTTFGDTQKTDKEIAFININLAKNITKLLLCVLLHYGFNIIT